MRRHAAVWLNLSLIILFPVAWTAPLLRAGLLPLFGMSEISVLSGLASLWDNDRALALIVALFALVLPYAKVIGVALWQAGRLPRALHKPLTMMAKFAMADVFLVALYIVVAKGMNLGRVETAWGLYLFTACVLVSLLLSLAEARRR